MYYVINNHRYISYNYFKEIPEPIFSLTKLRDL